MDSSYNFSRLPFSKDFYKYNYRFYYGCLTAIVDEYYSYIPFRTINNELKLLICLHVFRTLESVKNFGVWLSPVRAPALGAGGRRFESSHPDIFSLFSSFLCSIVFAFYANI